MRLNHLFLALLLVVPVFLTGCPDPEIVDISPDSMSLFGHEQIEIEIAGLKPAGANPLQVEVGGIAAINVHFDGTVIRCQPQGSPAAGPADVEITYGVTGRKLIAEDAIFFTQAPYPELSRIYNFGPSLSAGITNMGWEPEGQIHSVPAFVSRQLGAYFPQRIVLEHGVPPIGAPDHVDLMFVGDGVRECYVPALNETRIPEPGELCTPLIWDLADIPIGPLVVSVFGDILKGILKGDGLVGGLMQDPGHPVRNVAVPGAQMVDYAFGSRIGFNYFQWMIVRPTTPLFNPVCLGEPTIKILADADPNLVIAFDWFFDSVLFSHPPLHDLWHQLLFGMLVLSTSNFYNMEVCPDGQDYGGWGVPLIHTDGSGTHTFQPYQNLPEACGPNIKCSASYSDTDEIIALLERDPMGLFDDLGQPKKNIAVDYLHPDYVLASLLPPDADINGNGYLDIDFENPANMEITPELIASIIGADDPSDNPTAVILSTMPWPAMSPSGQGGQPGGGDDQFCESVNVGVNGLYEIFEQAFDLAGLPNNIVMMDVFSLTREVMEGNRPELTHLLDGDPSTMDIWYEYDPGPPLKRSMLKHGGAFSLDHLHMSETMNAAIATEIIRILNDRFGIHIPELDLPSVWMEDPYRYSNYDPSIQCEYLGVNCP